MPNLENLESINIQYTNRAALGFFVLDLHIRASYDEINYTTVITTKT
jgi:hypothetical protein